MEGLYPLPKTITHTDSQNLTIWKTIGYPLPTRAIDALLCWSMCCQVEGRILQYSNAKPLQLGTALALTTQREPTREERKDTKTTGNFMIVLNSARTTKG